MESLISLVNALFSNKQILLFFLASVQALFSNYSTGEFVLFSSSFQKKKKRGGGDTRLIYQ